jgi:tetratricopeptide (TPR) repeat protein
MKYLLFLVLIFFFHGFLCAQTSHSDACTLLMDANSLYCSGKYRKSYKTLDTYRRLFPAHRLNEEALFAQGRILFEQKKRDQAKELFLTITDMKNYDRDESSPDFALCPYIKHDCKNILMPEMLLNLQHEACIYLYHIAMAEKDYESARKYLVYACEYYRFYYNCGTGDLQEDIRLSLLFSEYHESKGNKDSSIDVMLPYILEPQAYPLLYYEQLLERTAGLLHEYYEEDTLKREFHTSINEVYFIDHTHDAEHRKKPAPRIYFIRFRGIEIQVAPQYLLSNTLDTEAVQDYIRESRFYKILFDSKDSSEKEYND